MYRDFYQITTNISYECAKVIHQVLLHNCIITAWVEKKEFHLKRNRHCSNLRFQISFSHVVLRKYSNLICLIIWYIISSISLNDCGLEPRHSATSSTSSGFNDFSRPTVHNLLLDLGVFCSWSSWHEHISKYKKNHEIFVGSPFYWEAVSQSGNLKCVSKVLGQMWALLALRKCPRTFETHFRYEWGTFPRARASNSVGIKSSQTFVHIKVCIGCWRTIIILYVEKLYHI